MAHQAEVAHQVLGKLIWYNNYMNIFKQIKNSIYNPIYYKNVILTQPFHESLKYLLKVTLLASLLVIVIFSFSLPKFFSTVRTMVGSEVANYPDDLVISIKNGNASINKPEPYSIKLSPASSSINDSQKTKVENVFVIDTTKSFNLDAFRSYSTLALLTKTDIVLPKDEKGTIQILPLSSIKDTQITKVSLNNFESKLFKFFPLIIVFMVLFGYIGIFVGYLILNLFTLIIFAFFIWLLSKIKGGDLTYKQSYQVGLHAITVVIFLSILSFFFPVFGKFVIKSVAVLLVVYINIFSDSKAESSIEIEAK
mgnify:FL=1